MGEQHARLGAAHDEAGELGRAGRPHDAEALLAHRSAEGRRGRRRQGGDQRDDRRREGGDTR